MDATQKTVNGTVRLKLYKGNCIPVGRKSDQSLYQESFATFEEDQVYDPGRCRRLYPSQRPAPAHSGHAEKIDKGSLSTCQA